MTSITSGTAYQTLFTYDGLGRLRIRQDNTWNGSSWVLSSQTWYLYDGRRIVQERDGTNTPQVSYTRGVDLGGSLESAGGIGGLLARSSGYSGGLWSTHYYYHADGNGNVTCLISASQVVTAAYRYDPFGNTFYSGGGVASANVYRFSSKMVDRNSGIYYYGYRHYDPNLQRWLNRDPIGETGGVNLYGFAGNSPLALSDPYGLAVLVGHFDLNMKHPPKSNKSCTPKQQMQIKFALKEGCRRANASNAFDALGRFAAGKLRRICDDNYPDTYEFVCDDDSSKHCSEKDANGNLPCGWSTSWSRTMHLCQRAWDASQCDLLGCTVVHEMVHGIGGYTGEDKPLQVEKSMGCRVPGSWVPRKSLK